MSPRPSPSPCSAATLRRQNIQLTSIREKGREVRLLPKLRFNVKIEARGSKLAVVSADGHETKVPIIAPISDTTEPLALAGRITGLQPGAYRLRWQALGIDRQVSQGEIPFTVK